MNNHKFIKLICLVVAVLMLCACGQKAPQETTAPTTATTEPKPQETTASPTVPTFEEQKNPITFFSLSMGQNYENVMRMDAFANYDTGAIYVEYVGEVKKVGDFDPNIFNGMTEAFNNSGLAKLVGQDVYNEGETNGSMYVEFADGTVVSVGFSGTIPEAFAQGFAAMDVFFQELTADLPVYVPQPLVMGEIPENMLNETLEILQGSGIEALDSFTVMEIPMDEYFAYTAGLTSADGISNAVNVAPMMMTTAYSLVIVSLEDAAKAADICADFEKNMDWTKWVCVNPSSAMLAQKDNMVLFLMSFEELGTGTYAGIAQAGWTEVKTFTNPNMQ